MQQESVITLLDKAMAHLKAASLHPEAPRLGSNVGVKLLEAKVALDKINKALTGR